MARTKLLRIKESSVRELHSVLNFNSEKESIELLIDQIVFDINSAWVKELLINTMQQREFERIRKMEDDGIIDKQEYYKLVESSYNDAVKKYNNRFKH